MCDVCIGRVWGIPMQSDTVRGHITIYLTEILWGRGLCGGGERQEVGSDTPHVVESTARHQVVQYALTGLGCGGTLLGCCR